MHVNFWSNDLQYPQAKLGPCSKILIKNYFHTHNDTQKRANVRLSKALSEFAETSFYELSELSRWLPYHNCCKKTEAAHSEHLRDGS